MQKSNVSKIVCQVYRDSTVKLQNLLRSIGVSGYHLQLSRSAVYQESSGFLFFPPKTTLQEDPLDYIEFYLPSEAAESVMGTISQALELTIPGRGSIYAEQVELVSGSGDFVNLSVQTDPESQKSFFADNLAAICCIVQRGEGNAIISAALDMGSTVPVITFGEGTGLRNKLGLLRITIPAEKEILHLVVSRYDLNEIRDKLIEVGHIDQPGKGFIYHYEVGKGIINSKIFYGKQKHVANMEQVIFAIDNLSGNTQWRKRFANAASADSGRKFLKGIWKMNMICNDGSAMDLVAAAMSAGAAGATISRSKFMCSGCSEGDHTATARENADMIIGEKNIPVILEALEKAGLYDPKVHGMVELKPVVEACTYIPG